MLSFLNISALLGLFSVSIPILIHFFARQKLMKVHFSSTIFLKQIQKQKIRRVQIRQLLLLILRCFIIFTFILALARPTFRGTAGIGRHTTRSSAILILDNSLSMHRSGLYPGALKNLDETLNLYTQEDDVWIYPAVPSQFRTLRYTARGMLTSLGDTASWQYGDLYRSLFEAVMAIKQSVNLNQEIFIFSDFQKTAFPSYIDSSLQSNWDGRIFLIPQSGETENIGILGGGIEEAILHYEQPLNVFAEIKNYGKEKAENRLIRLFIQNRPVAQRMINLEPRETQKIVFQVTSKQTGWIWGSIQLEDDVLLQDNLWYFTMRIPDQLRVLMVGSDPSDFQFLRLALNPNKKNQNSFFEMQSSLYSQPWEDELSQWHVIFLMDIPYLTNRQIIQIRQYIKGGGGLFLIPGPNLDLRNMNAHFLQPILEMNWLKIRGEQNNSNASLSVGKVDYQHPVFHGIFEKGKMNFHSPQFYMSVESAGGFNTILSLTNGQPLLVEKKYGNGNVFVLNSGLDPSWSNLAYSTLFSPMILKSVFYLASASQQVDVLNQIGRPVSYMTETDDVSNSYHVLIPGGQEITLLPKINQGNLTLQLDRSTAPGIYRFYQARQLLGMTAVNIDSLESDLETIQTGEVQDYFPDADIRKIDNGDQVEKVVSESRYGREIQREMFILCFLLLVAEMTIARSGRMKN